MNVFNIVRSQSTKVIFGDGTQSVIATPNAFNVLAAIAVPELEYEATDDAVETGT
jgi:hypothetical protein